MTKSFSQGGSTEQLDHIEYGSLPYATHPIDTVTGYQGFGPFDGPYTPWDFADSQDIAAPGGVNVYWTTQGDNRTDYAPPYAVITAMQDRSLDFASNPGLTAVLMQNAAASPNTSTASNANNVQLTGVNPATVSQHGFFSTLRDWIGSLANV